MKIDDAIKLLERHKANGITNVVALFITPDTIRYANEFGHYDDEEQLTDDEVDEVMENLQDADLDLSRQIEHFIDSALDDRA